MFSSEEDPFENVRVSLRRGLSDPNKTDDPGYGIAASLFQGTKFSMEELKRMQDVYMAEAKRLQQEVNDLEGDLEEENMAALSIPNSTLELLRTIMKMRKDDEQAMEELHKMQANLTGVYLTDATTCVVGNNPECIIRSQTLEGNCSGLGFAATFEVEERLIKTATEDLDEEDSEEPRESQEKRRAFIRKLDLEVEPHSLDEIAIFLTEVETHCQLQPFLRGYPEFAKWFQHRVKTYTHFKKLYPEIVSLPRGPDGTVLQIMIPGQRGIVYTITWKIQMTASGKATPDISLSVKAAREVVNMDVKETLQRAPEEFRRMVDTLGVEEALDTFLRAVAPV